MSSKSPPPWRAANHCAPGILALAPRECQIETAGRWCFAANSRSSRSLASLARGDLRPPQRPGALVARQHGHEAVPARSVGEQDRRPLGRGEPPLCPLQRGDQYGKQGATLLGEPIAV